MNNDLRYGFEAYANLIPNYKENRNSRNAAVITEWANKYCEAFDNGDEENKNIYISALMLKFWDNVSRMYEKVKATGYEMEDCVTQLYKCISAALEYRAWQDPANETTAKACINQLIASRGAPEILYEYNRDNKKANVNTVSFDQPKAEEEDSLTFGETTEDESESPDIISERLTAENLVQHCVNKNKIVEAIIMDTIAFNDCEKEIKETRTATNVDTGEPHKYQVIHREFWPYKCVQLLNELPADYENYFVNRYSIDQNILQAAIAAIKKAPNTKLYKYLDSTLNFVKASYAR